MMLVSDAAARTRGAQLHTLLICSHVVHYRHGDRFHAYGPYAREIDVWAELFPQVVIAAPCMTAPPPGDAVAFRRANIAMAPMWRTGGDSLRAKVTQLACLPALVWGLSRAMQRADAIHVRCPGNLGLLGAVMAPCFSRHLVAKYAGQWNGYPGEPGTVRLQRALLRSRWWRGPVTVYGSWPDQPRQVVPFFTSMMTREQVERAVRVASWKTLETPLRILFSGRLETVKRADALLAAVRMARESGVAAEVVILGDGPQRQALQSQAAALGIDRAVTFVGAHPFDRALDWYAWAHCLVLPSLHSEGWPKVIAEAMCHGLLCIAVDHGQVGAMLADRGILLRSGTAEEIAEAIADVACAPNRYEPRRRRASEWARQFSLEGLRDAISDLLAREWGVTLPAGRGQAAASTSASVSDAGRTAIPRQPARHP